MSFENAAQQVVFAALSGHVGCTVYDSAPALPEGMPSDAFPYVVIGNDTAAAWDTDDTNGANCTVTLHFWSRAEGFAAVKALMGAAYGLLHRQGLTKAGFNIIHCLWEFSEASSDPDGVTKHGVQRYRLTMQEG